MTSITLTELSRSCLMFFAVGFAGAAVIAFVCGIFFATRRFTEVSV